MPSSGSVRVGLVIFEGCDAMDLIGPYEVLLTANRLLARDGRPAAFAVEVVGSGPTTVFGGMGVVPTTVVGLADSVASRALCVLVDHRWRPINAALPAATENECDTSEGRRSPGL